MTAVLTAPVDTPVDRRRAMLALARVEFVRLLRSPITVVAAVLFLAPWIYGWIAGTANEYPVLHEETVRSQFLALLVFGNAALVAANFAALRAHRHRVAPLFDVLLLPQAWRTGALLLAVLAPAALALVVCGLRIGVVAVLPGAAGRLVLWDFLTVPAVVALFGVFGVLLARLTRSAVVAPVVALLLSAVAFILPVGGASRISWRLLLPTISPEFPVAIPTEILGRPAGPHLVYVVGLAAVFSVLALVHSGARRQAWVAGALALIVTVGGAATQFRADPGLEAARRTMTDDPAASQTCRTIDDVRYCAFDDFVPWIDGWDGVLRDVRRAVPTAGGAPIVVRQHVLAVGYPDEETVSMADVPAGPPEEIPVGTQWGDRSSEAVFASAVAYRLIAGQAWQTGRPVCGSRGALLVWLVGQAGGDVAEGLRQLDETSWNALVFGDLSGYGALSVPDADAAAGLALLEKPNADAVVRQHWAELTAPGTDAERFAAIVGVPAAQQPPVEERAQC